jgi:transposase
VAMYREGNQTAKSIGEILGVGQKTVSKWLRSAGLDVQISGRRPGYAPKKLRFLAQAKEMHEAGDTVNTIGNAIGVHYGTVAIWLREEGLIPHYAVAHSQETQTSQIDPRTSPHREEGLRLWQKGFTALAISKALTVPVGTVNTWISRSGLEGKGGKAVQHDLLGPKILELYKANGSIEKTAKTVGISYYKVKSKLVEAGVLVSDTAFGICAAEDCGEPIYSPGNKYHSDDCRRASFHKPVDPDKYEDFLCPNFADPQCRCHDGSAGKSYPRRLRNGHENKYCSTHCARRYQDIPSITTDDVRLKGSYEQTLWAICGFLKVPIERVDRVLEISFESGGGTKYYAPDFKVGNIWVETKGFCEEDDLERVEAWRGFHGATAIVTREVLDTLRKCDTAVEVYTKLKEIADAG